ncbi:hypothetical protein DFH06DRAFT_593683 [Mycena polygramma]|nr:hypothetical protein DFH06DRAFT_593683 [Mycena polygramma]
MRASGSQTTHSLCSGFLPRPAMSILSLSVELVQEIAYMIPSDHKQLRVTCKNLSFAVAPLFFSSVLLDVQQSRLEVGLSHLEALAAGNTPWSQFARTLKIEHLYPAFLRVGTTPKYTDDELQLANERLKQLIKPALESLKNVRTVIWNCDGDTDSTIETVVNFLSSHPVLEDFRLTAHKANVHFGQLTGLRNLTLKTPSDSGRKIAQSLSQTIYNSPDLESLYVELRDNISFAELSHSLVSTRPLRLTRLHITEDYYHASITLDGGIIPHLKSLKCLKWIGGDSGSTAASAAIRHRWDVLREAGIHLTEIHSDRIEEGLLAYLSSYSGLERLCITWADGKNKKESNRRADKFFARVLPQHAQSLISLSCCGGHEGRWSLGDHNAGMIEQLHNLRSLRMSVNSKFEGWTDPPRPPGTRRVRRSEIYSVERDSQGNSMVHRFLELIQRLPIVDAAILSSSPDSYRGNKCGNNAVSHERTVIREIGKAVREFVPPVARSVPSVVVFDGYNYYKLEAGEDRYRRVGSREDGY